MANPGRKGIKGWFLNTLEAQGYLLLNTTKIAARDTWWQKLEIATVLDVGADIGDSALEWHRKLPNAKVFSFEPLPDSFQKMKNRLAGQPWWQGFCLAAGSASGTEQIHRSEYSLSSSLLPMADLHKTNYPYTAGASLQQIEVARLDDVLEKEGIRGPFLLKLDVQGFEIQALEGAVNTLKQCHAIVCETSFVELYKGQKLFGEVAAFLNHSGFAYQGSAGQRNSPLNGQPLQQDAIFLPITKA
jgi:FkbM family methyltransferase